VCILPERLALAMSALAQMKAEPAMIERLADPSEMSAVEQDGVKEAASFIAAALGEYAKDSTGGRIVLSPAPPRYVPGDGVELLAGTEEWIVLDGFATVASAPVQKIALAFPTSLVRAWSGPDSGGASIFGGGGSARATSGSSSSSAKASRTGSRTVGQPAGVPVLWVAGREALGRTVAEAVADGFTLRGFPTLAELLAAAEAEPAPGVVLVEVANGSEFQLDLVAALRRHPSLASSGVVVALENPTRRHVVRCGSLGLLEVIPTAIDPAALGARLSTVSRAAARRVAKR
jgi:hypothetical protein